MKFIGIDYGARKIGIALADDQTKLALPFKVIEETDRQKQIKEIAAIAEQERADKIVIGLPLSKKGEQTAQTRAVKDFVRQLTAGLPGQTPIDWEDERLTTKLGGKLIKEVGKGPEDAVAAALILQSYLDRSLR